MKCSDACYSTVVRIATPKATMFTYAQLVRVIQMVEELQRMVESISFTDRLPWTLVSCVMVYYVVRYLYHSRVRYNRLIVAQRENRRMHHEIGNLRRLPIQNGLPQIQNGPRPIPVPVAEHVPGAAQGVEDGPVEQQMPRQTLEKALDHMQKLTESLKEDTELLVEMEGKHQVQRKTAGAEDAKGIKLYKKRRKVHVVANKKEGKEAMDALRAKHGMENPNPTAAEIDEQTIELSDLHMTISNANVLARRDYDTEMMDLLATHKNEASELVDRQTSEKRAFEDKCLHEHSRNVRARY